jgi:hypothetical protein
MSEIIVALDLPSSDEALGLVDRLGDAIDFYKVGSPLFTRSGPPLVRELRDRGKRVFLDLKYHDIPSTVGNAVHAAADLGIDLLTLHASGGEAMMPLPGRVRRRWRIRPRLLGVTILTSFTAADVEQVWNKEIISVRDEVGAWRGSPPRPASTAWLRRPSRPSPSSAARRRLPRRHARIRSPATGRATRCGPPRRPRRPAPAPTTSSSAGPSWPPPTPWPSCRHPRSTSPASADRGRIAMTGAVLRAGRGSSSPSWPGCHAAAGARRRPGPRPDPRPRRLRLAPRRRRRHHPARRLVRDLHRRRRPVRRTPRRRGRPAP